MFFMICSPPMLGIGLLIAVIGRVRLFRHSAYGLRARFIGLLLMLPFPLAVITIILAGNGNIAFEWYAAYSLITQPILILALPVVAVILLLTAPRTKIKTKGGIILPDLLSVDEAANYLHVSPQDVEQLIQSGNLPTMKEQGSDRISRDALMRFLQ